MPCTIYHSKMEFPWDILRTLELPGLHKVYQRDIYIYRQQEGKDILFHIFEQRYPRQFQNRRPNILMQLHPI